MSYPVTYAVRFRDGEPVGGAGEPGAPGAGAGWEAVAPAALITRVGFDVDDVAPRAPWASTVTRSLCPTSRRLSTYAPTPPRRGPPIALQADPVELQRCHWKRNVVAPFQRPRWAWRT